MALYLGSKIIAGAGTLKTDLLGLPTGGSTGQYLVKKTNTDGDAIWQTLPEQKTHLSFKNINVAASSFVSNTTLSSHPYRASVALTGVTESMIPSVTFSQDAVNLGVLASVANTYNGGIYIYASEVPSGAISILSALVWEA